MTLKSGSWSESHLSTTVLVVRKCQNRDALKHRSSDVRSANPCGPLGEPATASETDARRVPEHGLCHRALQFLRYVRPNLSKSWSKVWRPAIPCIRQDERKRLKSRAFPIFIVAARILLRTFVDHMTNESHRFRLARLAYAERERQRRQQWKLGLLCALSLTTMFSLALLLGKESLAKEILTATLPLLGAALLGTHLKGERSTSKS
jgi:hypothetical protein